MVVFSCDNCGDSVKKQQVDKHRLRCGRNVMFCCLDCQRPFYGDEYKAHTKCVSEAQRYGGVNYVAKENKGEAKQDAWTDQVSAAIERCPVGDRPLKAFMDKLADYPNVPRKEKKFNNFAVNSISRDTSVLQRAWLLIQSVAPPPKPATNGKRSTDGSTEAEEGDDEATPTAKRSKPQSNGEVEEEVKAEENKPIKWRKIIRTALKSNESSMRQTALRDAVWTVVGAHFDDKSVFDAEFDAQLTQCRGVNIETVVFVSLA